LLAYHNAMAETLIVYLKYGEKEEEEA